MKKRARKNKKDSGPRHPRLVARGDGLKLQPVGHHRLIFADVYVRLLGLSWKQMVVLMVTFYLFINLLFAYAYLATGNGITNARPGSFADAFFFSVQTMATIGYGGMSPRGLPANILVTIESLFGFAFFAVITGLVFSKFSRPTARVLFSNKAVIGMFNGKPHFMLRLANERHNRIVDASAKLTLMRDEVTMEGTSVRRFYDLLLVRKEIPILRLTWTVMHLIDQHSPLYKMTNEKLDKMEAEILVSLTGIDETLSQSIQARHSYIAEEIVYNAAFQDILQRREDYVLEIHYEHFHDIKLTATEE